MTQNFLLLKACRRSIVYASILGVVLPIGLLILARLDGANEFQEIILWISNHARAFTVYAAGLAAFCHLIAGLPSALEKLPMPVSARQRAYLPLGFALLHWFVLLGILAVALTLGSGPSHLDRALRFFAGAIAGIPLGFFIIAVTNRNAGNTNVLSFLGMPFYAFQGVFTSQQVGPISHSEIMNRLYETCWPAMLLCTLLIIRETPIHRQNWRRAAFILFPTPVSHIALREPLAPQRFHFLTLAADIVTLAAMLVGGLVFVTLMLAPFQHGFLGSSRPPVWIEQTLLGALLVLMAFFVLGFAVVKGLLLMQVGSWQQDGPWAQRFLRIAGKLEFVIPNRRLLPGKFVGRDPASGQFFMHAFRADSDEGAAPEVCAPRQIRFDRRVGWVFALQFLVMGFTMNTFDRDVDMDRAGSGIQGDTLAQPDRGYRGDRSFSQHYVALNLGGESSPDELDKAYATIQSIIATSGDPASWLDGLTGIDGLAASIPEKFRVEIARPEPSIVVIQSIGLHWNPSGHLAYGLARRIMAASENLMTVQIDDTYSYVRPRERFMQSYGFLDNGIHWVHPVADSKGSEGNAPPPLPSDAPVFVDKRNTNGRQNGKSWDTAYNTIQEGIDAAYRRRVAGVWVAGGIYDEERYGDGSLYMRPGVHLYGGFAGGESNRTQRNLDANPTWIDGSVARNGEAAYHVIVGASYATLDGFTITGGNADDDTSPWADGGAGLLVYRCDPAVANCNFIGNSAKRSGGAIFVYSGNVTFDRCTFEGNSSMDSGGAFYIGDGMAHIRRSTFRKNRAQRYADAIHANGGKFAAETCLFYQNGEGTSSIIIYGDEFSLFNCTLVGNGDGGPSLLGGQQSKASITNSIVWNSPGDLALLESPVTHSIIPGGHPGEGNLDADPLFADPEGDDFRLQSGSPAIDAGTMEGAPGEDLDGNPRPLGSGIDIGAYEHAVGSP